VIDRGPSSDDDHHIDEEGTGPGIANYVQEESPFKGKGPAFLALVRDVTVFFSA
jgi:hypothetical protein